MPIINPYRSIVSSISPTEYEKYCTEILKNYADQEQLKDFSIEHDVRIPSDDGTYQLDIYATFTALGVKFQVIAECKRYTNPVPREKVVILADKVKSLGAQKGILISTSGFQSGAFEYAQKHGIALIQILDKHIVHIQNACDPQTEEQKRVRHLMMEEFRRMPDYYAFEYHWMDFPDRKIYPSQKQVHDIMEKMCEEMRLQMVE